MTPEERAALERQLYEQRVGLSNIQEDNRLRRMMLERQANQEQARQVFSDIPANSRPRLASNLVSDNTYSPFLSQNVGGVSVRPLLDYATTQGKELEGNLSQLQELYRNIPHIEKDREAVNEALKQYQISPELINDKFAAQKVQHLSTKLREDLKSTNNVLGAAYHNYNTRQKWFKQLDDSVKNLAEGGDKGGITAQTAQYLKNIYDSKYKGIGGDGSPNQVFNDYSTTNPANISNKEKLVLDYVNDWKKDKTAFANNFLSREADGRVYIRGKSGSKEYVDENDIRSVLPQFLRNNKVIDEDVTQQAMIETHFQDSDAFIENRKQQILYNYERQNDMLNKLENKKNLTENDKKMMNQLKNSVKSLYEQANQLHDARGTERAKEIHQQIRKNEIYNDLVNMAVNKEAHAQYSASSSMDENQFDIMRAGWEREDEKNRLQQVTLMSANYQIQTGQPADLSLNSLEPFKKLVPYDEMKDKETQWRMDGLYTIGKDEKVREHLIEALGYRVKSMTEGTMITPTGKVLSRDEVIKTYDDLAKASKTDDVNTQIRILAENNPFLKRMVDETKRSLNRVVTENGKQIDYGLTKNEVAKVFENYNKMINGLSSSPIVYDSYTVGSPQYQDMQKFIKDDNTNNFTSNFWNMYVIEDGNKKSMSDYIKDKFGYTPDEFNKLPATSKEGSDEVSRKSILDKISIGGRQFGNIVEGQYQANIDGKPVSLGFNNKAGMANELQPFDAFRQATYENKEVPVSFEQAVGIAGIRGKAKSKIIMNNDEFLGQEQVLVLDNNLPHKDDKGSFVVVPIAWDETGKESQFKKVYEGQEIPVEVLQNIWRLRNRTANQSGDTKRTNSGLAVSQVEQTSVFYKKP